METSSDFSFYGCKLSLNQGRLELVKEQPSQNTLQIQETGNTIVFQANQPREERSVKVKAFHRWNPFHHLEIGLKKSVLVNLNGTQLLINVGSIVRRTALSREDVVRDTHLIQNITIAIAKRCLEPIDAERPAQLGKGVYGKAVAFRTNLGIFVAKYARKNQPLGEADVAKEFANHQRFFRGNKSPIYGLQIPYHWRQIISFPRKSSENDPAVEQRGVMANIGHLYNGGNFIDFINEPENRTLDNSVCALHQVFYALHQMESQGVTHEDIKGANFLVDNINGGVAVDLADLASLQFMGDPIPAVLSGTPVYTAITDRARYNQLSNRVPTYRGADGEEYLHLAPDSERYLAIRSLKAKRDVFAAGATIYMALTGQRPYKLSIGGLAAQTDYESIPDIPDSLNNLLSRMLDFNSETRISGTEAWNEFNQILDGYPDLKMRVDANIAAIGRAPQPIV